jgi:hypothetical protein
MQKTILLAVLFLVCVATRIADAAVPELSVRDYNAAREYAYKYFNSYRQKYERAMRTREILKACGLNDLAAKIDHDLPKVSLYAGEQFKADPKSTPFDLSRPGMALAVALATQSLVEGYELGFGESEKSDLKIMPDYCVGAGNTYNDYLKGETK